MCIYTYTHTWMPNMNDFKTESMQYVCLQIFHSTHLIDIFSRTLFYNTLCLSTVTYLIIVRGSRILNSGSCIPDSRSWTLSPRSMMKNPGSRILDS